MKQFLTSVSAGLLAGAVLIAYGWIKTGVFEHSEFWA